METCDIGELVKMFKRNCIKTAQIEIEGRLFRITADALQEISQLIFSKESITILISFDSWMNDRIIAMTGVEYCTFTGSIMDGYECARHRYEFKLPVTFASGVTIRFCSFGMTYVVQRYDCTAYVSFPGVPPTDMSGRLSRAIKLLIEQGYYSHAFIDDSSDPIWFGKDVTELSQIKSIIF